VTKHTRGIAIAFLLVACDHPRPGQTGSDAMERQDSPAPPSRIARWDSTRFTSTGTSPPPSGDASASPSALSEKETGEVLELVTYLASLNRYDAKLDARRWAPMDADVVVRHVSERGVRFTNMNGMTDVRATAPEIRRQVRARRGPHFATLAHIGKLFYVHGTLHPRDYEIRKEFELTVLNLVSYYSLTFERENGELRLVRCDYMQKEELNH
jgi:hypothetical protein